ncbi:MAG: glycosyltransferase family 2 protein, partial [Planctomycetota bacterium]
MPQHEHVDTSGRPMVSIIAPVYNEQGNLRPLFERLGESLSPVTGDYEVLFVDDGSTDGSVAEIESLIAADGRVKLIEFSRNFGKEFAMLAGYDHARGRAVVVVDADLQTPPDVIPKMIEKWQGGAEIVDGVRQQTEGIGWARRGASDAFYWIMRRAANTDVIPNAVDFRLMDRRVVEHVRSCRERFRFNRGLAGWVGFRRESVPFVAEPRPDGRGRWPALKLLGYAMDAIISFSAVPLRVAGFLGLTISLLSFLYLVIILLAHVFGQQQPGYSWGACNCCASGPWASTSAGCTRRSRAGLSTSSADPSWAPPRTGPAPPTAPKRPGRGPRPRSRGDGAGDRRSRPGIGRGPARGRSRTHPRRLPGPRRRGGVCRPALLARDEDPPDRPGPAA